jgi:hypothetical protein
MQNPTEFEKKTDKLVSSKNEMVSVIEEEKRLKHDIAEIISK